MSQPVYLIFYLRQTTCRDGFTLTILKYCMYSATVGAALTVHQYGKTCRKYSPCCTVLEHCTLFKQCKFTVFSPVILSKEDTLRVASRRCVCYFSRRTRKKWEKPG